MIKLSVSLASNGVVKVPGYEQMLRFGYTKNRGVYRLAVTASGEWEGLAIRCFWHAPDGKDPPSSLVVDGYVDVPASVTAQPGNGCITFEGSDGTKTVTSADLRYRVAANSGTEDGTEPEPGTPAWQAFVDAVKESAALAKQSKTESLDAAERAGASAQKAEQALSDTITAKEDALKAIGDKQTAATQAVDTARDKALQQVEASTKVAQTAASEAAASAGNADQSAQEAADSLQELKNGIANGNFKGEKGDKGDTGPIGPVGPQGEQGPKGETGPAVALDTTLTHEGEAADAKATGDAVRGVRDDLVAEATRAKGAENQLKEDLDDLMVSGKNLLNDETITPDKNFALGTTDLIDARGYSLTDYIAVDYGETLYFSRYNVSGDTSALKALARIVEYGADKNPVEKSVNSATTFTPTNTNCKFVRCSFRTSNNTSNYKTMISKSSDIDYESFYKRVKNEYLPEIPNYSFDDKPTENSSNLLTSGAVYNAFKINNQLFDYYLPNGVLCKEITYTYLSDMCMVNDDLWVFNASADNQTTPTEVILSYAKVSILDKNNWNEKAYFYHNFGHCNSVSYRKEDDSLIFGNGSTTDIDAGFSKRCFYIIQGISSALKNANIDTDGSITGEAGAKYIDLLTNAIEYDVTDFGYKCNAIFGPLPRNVFVITNDGQSVKELILGRSTVNFGNGKFIEEKTSNQYNGTYKVIKEWSIDTFPDVVQGAEYNNGYIYFGVGHSDRWICRAKLTSKDSLELESYKDIIYTNGGVKTSQTSSGITFNGDRMLLICSSGYLLEYPLIH